MSKLHEHPDQQGETKRFVAADRVVLMADVWGQSGRTEHGGGQTRHSWADAMRALMHADYYVINCDLRGHGESGWSPNGIYSYPLLARDLVTVIERFDGPIALIGASMGGITAMQTITDGLRTSALVLVDIVLHPERSEIGRIRAFMAGHLDGYANLEDAVEAVVAYNPNRPRPKDRSGLRGNLRLGAGGQLRWHWDPRIISHDLDADLAAIERVLKGMPFVTDIPTLLIRGLHSVRY